jgi:hypothetical protein
MRKTTWKLKTSNMKKIVFLAVISLLGKISIAQKETNYLMAWCSSKELKEIKLGCLADAPMLICLENNDWVTRGYKIAFVDAEGNKMIFTSNSGKAIGGLIEKAKGMHPLYVEVFDIIVGDKENAVLVDQKFRYPVSY